MALADTARLLATLELQDKFSGPSRNAEGALGRVETKVGNLNRAAGNLSRGVGNAVGAFARIGTGAAVAGIGFLAVNIKAGVDSLNDLENVTVATNTVIASTGGVAGISADKVRALAEEYESLNATMDDKVIQSGANLLLTFTNIRQDAFEPALEAALNMNEALGGDESSLQARITQVGKALQDPIRGLTALSRNGVVFTAQQKEQIKALQESGDLLGAQQIILSELSTEYGGRFAAAGDTAEGSQARLRDTIEDLQIKLAGPLLPAIDRVRDKLTDFLASPAALTGAEKLGDAIAGLFTDANIDRGVGLIERGITLLTTGDFSGVTSGIGTIASTVGSLPWAAIGDAARLLGTGSKALLDAFLGLPPWVQTAVLTGWGLNKLTGGALGGIVGELGKGLIKGVLGMNAGVVNINAATVNGGGGGLPGGRGGGIGGALRGAATGAAVGLGVGAAAIAAVEVVNFEQYRAESREHLQGVLDELPRTASTIDESIARVEDQINQDRPLLEGVLFNTNVRPQLEEQLRELQNVKAAQERGVAAARDAIPWAQRNVSEIQNLNASEGRRFADLGALSRAEKDAIYSLNASEGARAATSHALLGQIRDKKPPTTMIKLTTNVNVVLSASQANFELQSLRETVGGGGSV